MPLYIGDYLAATTHLSAAEHGAYLLLIMHCWRHGGKLPDNDRRIKNITCLSDAEWAESRATLMAFFEGGRHKRIDAELQKAENMIEQRRVAGKASANRRWCNGMGNGNITKM